MTSAGYRLAVLARLREQAHAARAAALARTLAAADREASALAARRAEARIGRAHLDVAVSTVPGEVGPGGSGGAAALAAAERFRGRVREEVARSEAAAAAQAARLASAEEAAGRARSAHAAARAALRAVEAHRERWLAGRRAVRELAEERERDDARPAAGWARALPRRPRRAT